MKPSIGHRYRNSNRIVQRRRQRGVGIVTAIFLLVVLAGLGAAMVSLYTTQQASSNLDLQGARAYQAARAGLEWGLFQQLRNGAASKCNATPSRIAMPADGALNGFTAFVRCTSTSVGNGGAAGATDPDTSALVQSTVSSTACNMPGAAGCAPVNQPEFVSRTVEAQL